MVKLEGTWATPPLPPPPPRKRPPILHPITERLARELNITTGVSGSDSEFPAVYVLPIFDNYKAVVVIVAVLSEDGCFQPCAGRKEKRNVYLYYILRCCINYNSPLLQR